LDFTRILNKLRLLNTLNIKLKWK